MMFYLKQSWGAEIEGPFAMEQINQMVRQKRFAFTSLALADRGQGLSEVKKTLMKQWVELANIPDFQPDPGEERKSKLLILAVVAFMVLIPIAALIMAGILLNRIH